MIKKIISYLICFSIILAACNISFVKAAGLNVALGKPVVGSNYYNTGHIMENAVDGNLYTVWANGRNHSFGTINGENFITVDLKKLYSITSIIVRSRRDMDLPYQREGWKVYISETEDFKKYVYLGQKKQAGPFEDDYELKLTEAIVGRYVRVTSLTDIVISELEVYGESLDEGAGIQFNDISEGNLINAANLVCYLGLCEPVSRYEFGVYNLVTRGEAAKICLNTINYGNVENIEDDYFGMDDKYEYKNYVLKCLELGIISNEDARQFKNYITINDFASMMVRAMGYTYRIEALQGKAEIANIINELRLTRRVSKSLNEEMNREELLYILYNSLTAPALKVQSVEKRAFKFNGNESLLERSFDLLLKRGVLFKNNVTSLIEPNSTKLNQVTIGEDVLITKNAEIGELIGQTLYYITDAEEHNELYTYWADAEKNMVKTISSENIRTLNDGYIEVYNDEGSTEKYNYSKKDVYVLKNGTAYVDFNDMDDFKNFYGEITLIDNNDDGEIDVIHVFEPIVLVCDFVTLSDNELNIGGIKGERFKSDSFFVLKVQNKNGKYVETDYLTKDNLFYIYCSDDGNYIKISISDNKVEGYIEEVSNDTIVVNGVSFGISQYYKENIDNFEELSIDKKVSLYINSQSKVAWSVVSDRIEGKIAFIQHVGVMSGVDRRPLVKLFTEDGEFLELGFAKRVRIDGRIWSDNEIADKIQNDKNNGTEKYFLDKFVIVEKDGKGLIDYVDTEKVDAYNDSRMSKPLKKVTGGNTMLRFGEIFYKGQYMDFPVKADTKVFRIPLDSNTQQIIKSDNVKSFYKIRTIASLYNDGDFATTECDLYGQDDEFGYPLFGVSYYNLKIREDVSLEDTGKPTLVLVEKISTKLMTDGQVSIAVKGYDLDGKSSVTYTLDSDIKRFYAHGEVFFDNYIGKITDCIHNGSIDIVNGDADVLRNYLRTPEDIKVGDIIACEVIEGIIINISIAYSGKQASENNTGVVYSVGANALVRPSSTTMIKSGFYEKSKDNILVMRLLPTAAETFNYTKLAGGLYVCDNSKIITESFNNLPSLVDNNDIMALTIREGKYHSIVIYKL